MKSAKLSKNELIDLIFYGVKENNVDAKNINRSVIESIISDYIMFCNYFQVSYVIGELDTFKRAACLLVAINRNKLTTKKELNASIALDTAYRMCEKPYWNVGDNYDVPKKLEEVDFKKAFEKNMEVYDKSKAMLIDSLIYENGSPLNYSLNLELFYQVALKLKHQASGIELETSVVAENLRVSDENPRQKTKTIQFQKK